MTLKNKTRQLVRLGLPCKHWMDALDNGIELDLHAPFPQDRVEGINTILWIVTFFSWMKFC